jgi:integrase
MTLSRSSPRSALTRANRQTEIAVRLLLLTMVRTIELRCAPWSEVNLEAAEWRIPAARMKKRRHHIVPLSKQAVVLFGGASRTHRQRPLSLPEHARAWAADVACSYRQGVSGALAMVGGFPHSFRGTAATMLRESGFRRQGNRAPACP